MKLDLNNLDTCVTFSFALYLSITLVLVNLFKVDELTRSFLALPALFAVLHNLGFFFTAILSIKAEFLTFNFLDVWSRLFIRIVLGFLFLMLVAVLTLLIGDIHTISDLVFMLAIISAPLIFKVRPTPSIRANVISLVNLFPVAALSIVPLCILRTHSSFPLQAEWDVFGYARASLLLTQDAYLPTQQFYLPYLEIIFGLISQWYGTGILQLTWALSFAMYSIYGLGIYLFILTVTKSQFFALAGAAFGVIPIFPLAMALYRPIAPTFIYISVPFALYLAVNTAQTVEIIHWKKLLFLVILTVLFASTLMIVVIYFTSGVFYGLYFRTLTSGALIIAFIWVLTKITRFGSSYRNIAPFLLLIVSYPMFHSIQGFSLTILSLSLFFVMVVWPQPSKTAYRALWGMSLLVLIIVFLEMCGIVSLFSNFRFVTSLEGLVYNFDSKTKYSILMDAYGWFPIAMLGIVMVQFIPAIRIRILGLMTSLILLVYFLPLSGMYRYMIYLTPFLVVFFLAAFAIIISSLSAKIKRKSFSIRIKLAKDAFNWQKRRYVHTVVLFVVYMFFITNGPITKILNAAVMTSGSDQFTFYSHYELEAAVELGKYLHDPPNILTDTFGPCKLPIKSYSHLIISDPATQLLFASLTKGQTVGDFSMSEETMKTLREAFRENNVLSTYKMLKTLADRPIEALVRAEIAKGLKIVRPEKDFPMRKFVIITPRTVDWISSDLDFMPTIYFWKNQFPIDGPLSTTITEKFRDTRLYSLIYRSEKVLIVELKELKPQAYEEIKLIDWGLRNQGAGSMQARFLSEHSGIEIVNGSFETWSLEKEFNTSLLMGDCFTLDWYGAGTDKEISIILNSGLKGTDYFVYIFKDDYVGWGKILFFTDLPDTVVGNPDLISITWVIIKPCTPLDAVPAIYFYGYLSLCDYFTSP